MLKIFLGIIPLISNDKLWLMFFFFVHFFPSFISNTSMVSINFRANLDLRMQEMAFPWGIHPQTPPFMRGILATHVAFSHCFQPCLNCRYNISIIDLPLGGFGEISSLRVIFLRIPLAPGL